MWIVIAGNPVDGLEFYGPFANEQDAIKWADTGDGSDWWITQLSDPA